MLWLSLRNLLAPLTAAACLGVAACGGDGDAGSGSSPLDFEATPELIDRGATLFTALGCQVCHREDDAAPGARLQGLLGTTVTLVDGRSIVRDRDYLARSILQPEIDKVPGASAIMPPYDRLSVDDLAALVAYVESL